RFIHFLNNLPVMENPTVMARFGNATFYPYDDKKYVSYPDVLGTTDRAGGFSPDMRNAIRLSYLTDSTGKKYALVGVNLDTGYSPEAVRGHDELQDQGNYVYLYPRVENASLKFELRPGEKPQR